MPAITSIRARRGTSAQWSSTNPILALGELGLDTTLNKLKLGDGATVWSALPFLLQSALDLKMDASQRAAANGVAPLGSDSKVPSANLPALPLSVTGTYSARPVATSLPAGTIYYATDLMEQYRTDGTSWTVVASGGNERGSASITAMYSTSNGIAGPPDVPGMTVTFVAGERPVRFQVDCDLANSIDAHTTSLQVMLDGTVIGTLEASNIGIDRWFTVSKGFRYSGLTPGTSHTVKLRIFVSGGIGRIGGGSANPSTLSVISL